MSQPATPPLSGSHHFAFSVRGLPASVAWYQKVFQATLTEGTLPPLRPRAGRVRGAAHRNLHRCRHWPVPQQRQQGRSSSTRPVPPSITSPSRCRAAIVFRDLDNIRLEFAAIDV